MVKLASAREARTYGSRVSRHRAEYMNAGLYIFATILLAGGFVAQFSGEPRSGLVLLLLGYFAVIIVNVHDLFAHLAAVDYRMSLMEYDLQLALVEFAVPLVYTIGTILLFVATLFLFVQAEKGYGLFKLETHALRMLIAGPVLWLIGSIHNSCQIYERSDAHIQILQEAVLIPFLLASVLFIVSAVINCLEHDAAIHHGLDLLGETCIWLCIIASLTLFIGAIVNVVKVFKMQQHNRMRLEKLRGGAQERLNELREGHMPLVSEDSRRRRKSDAQRSSNETAGDLEKGRAMKLPTPYKDVLLS
ncbi:hypothetical protein SASPL_149347 [Salvia splendens]|uniref:Uncharacterized protein n=1 Tax=Salvia splendens TaxID=180675 RepID=A0A8X8WCN3_SALSN|nr:uncharacterized protein LOC121778743 [Salvia splendens]XP_042032081.1 uncharacterized protein LOC121778743 [Salvia splendens]XP_042032082.1 uncharacterized protein LOC121778743 [Salvia splendens]KAG6391591.1 hypothetical protein SASPL_149347 [Salvia splendens]